jgi:hypothetical protein
MARKGLSQILFLIIAASVLMMAALTLIFAFNQGIGGGTSDVSNSACANAISTQCDISGDSSISKPANCPSDLGGVSGYSVNDDGTIDC